MLRIIRDGLPKDPTRWTRMSKQIVGVSEETTTGVKRLYEMQVSLNSTNNCCFSDCISMTW